MTTTNDTKIFFERNNKRKIRRKNRVSRPNNNQLSNLMDDRTNSNNNILAESRILSEHTSNIKDILLRDYIIVNSSKKDMDSSWVNIDNVSMDINSLRDRTDITDPDNVSCIVAYRRDNFLDLNYESYTDDAHIIRQFSIDFHRVKVFINNKRISTVEELFSNVSPFNRSIKIGNREISIIMLTLFLTCQSSFFLSFVHLNNKVESMKQKIIDEKRSNIDDRMNLMLTDLREKNSIYFVIDDKHLECSFRSVYQIIDISTEKPLMHVKADTVFSTISSEGLISYQAELK